jgi:streptogramin lyase
MIKTYFSLPIGLGAWLLSLLTPTHVRADVFIVARGGDNLITRVSSTGAKIALVDTGLSNPQAVAYDADGDLYVADRGSNHVLRFPANGGGPVQVGDSVDGLTSLAFDASGVLHVTSDADRTVRKLSGNSFVIVATLAAGASPRSITFAADGKAYVADATGNRIFEVTPAGGSTIFSDDVTSPFGVAFDSAGRLHAADQAQGGRIVDFKPNGKTRAVVSSLGSVRGLGFDRADGLFYGTATGFLRKVEGNGTVEIASQLGDALLFAVRSAQSRVVAFSGQTLSQPQDAQFASFGSPAIGGESVAFRGTLKSGVAGVASGNSSGIWRANGSGAIELVARKAFEAFGVSGAFFASLGEPVLNENGDIAFLGKMRAGVGGVTSANAAGVWADVNAGLSLVARQGDPAPGLDSGVVFAGFQQVVMPDAAGPAFLATVKGPGIGASNNLGLWSANTDGVSSLVIRKGDTLTAGGKSRKIASLVLFKGTAKSLGHGRNVSDGRQFVFQVKFTDGTRAILRAEPGVAPTVLLVKGDSVGAAVVSGVFSSFGQPSVTDDGALSYLAKLTPGLGDVTSSSSTAVFTDDLGRVLEARNTFAAHGTSGGVFASVGDPIVSRSGAMAFMGKLKAGLGDATSSNSSGLWSRGSGSGDQLGIAVRQGDGVSGVKGSVKFAKFTQFVLPDTGAPVFTATIAGSGITTANNTGLWACDGAGGVELLVRKGDKLSVNGTEKTITSVAVLKAAAGVAGQSRQFNADGDVCGLLKFSDKTQAVVKFVQP